ncbi:MAG: hypothetical protein ABSG19_10345 [Candidatus Aminicenantales bacterium]
MPRLKKPGRSGAALTAAVSGLLLLAMVGCKSPTSTDTVSSLTITNSSGAKIDVYLDGTAKLSIDADASGTIQNIVAGSHLLEAKKSDSGALFFSVTMTITASTSNTVTIGGGASLRITNLYGEILSIFLDDSWMGDIGDQISATLLQITFGTHVFTAKTKTDGTVAATITINVTDAIEYTWTITK